MKRFILLILTSMMCLVSCEFDDSALWDAIKNNEELVKQHENRLTKLELRCEQMNTTISGLQKIVQALQNNDYITSITPIKKGNEEIGYTISFTKSGTVSIYHGQDGADGKDGQDGADGKDGHTPVIGIKKASDEIYYWTLDGEWLLDNDGNKVKAEGRDGKDGVDGENGQDGADGTDGQDGKTPQLKIEDGYWYISIDGQDWQKLGKATGEDGKDGKDGIDGNSSDSFFQSVDTSDKNFVVFKLADGTEIKIPTWYSFEQLQRLCREMNTNITALQAIVEALQNNDYITSVAPVKLDSKEIGYVITFSKGESITIYHGKDGQDGTDGQDGADGKDGHTPVIGVKKASDETYYWTLDGEWLLDESNNKVKAEGRDGTDGQDGTDGVDGENGQDGADGTDGKDGQTPELKITEGYWYVRFGNGEWRKLGPATGTDGKDGADGQDGKDGDSFFQNVIVTDTDVTFVLSTGERIVLPKKGNETEETLTKIYYTSTDGKIVNVSDPSVFSGFTLLSNTYENGQGIMTYEGKVTGFGNEAFKNCSNLKTISLPNSVQYIGKNAFSYCSSLTSVTIPGSVTSIGNGAFSGCTSLTSVTIPGSVTTIGDNAFSGCTSLTSVTIPGSVTTIGNNAFSGCTSLTSVTIPGSVTTIGNNAFDGCTSLTSVTIPGSVTSFGIWVFKGCSDLTSVTIQEGATTIGGLAFYNCCSLSSITIPGSVTSIEYGAFSGCSSLTSVTIPGSVTSIEYGAFSGCSSLTSVTIPGSVTSIGNGAFSGCTSLTSVTIPGSVTTIGNNAFSGCTILTSVTIQEGVTSIGEYAFKDCSSLTSVTIPGSVTTIGTYVFDGCSKLVSVYCKPINVPTGSDYMFGYTDSKLKIYVPIESVDKYKSADTWSYYAADIVGYDYTAGK